MRLAPSLTSAALVVAALAAVAPAPVQAQAIAPHRSFAVLPWTNGWGSGAYDTVARKVVSLREHVYAARDAATATRDLAYDVYFGLRSGGQNTWLVDRPLADAGWDGARGLARVVQAHRELRATQHWFAPFAVPAPVLVGVVEIENTGAAAITDGALFALVNLHVGGGADGTVGERVRWQGGAFEERGARGLALIRGLPAPSHHAASPDNLLRTLLEGIQAPAFARLGHMPAFREAIDDRQLVELAAYLRGRFAPGQPPWADLPGAVARARAADVADVAASRRLRPWPAEPQGPR